MNKIFFILILSIFLSSNILAKTTDIVCKPNTEWDSSYKKKKIWFTFNKPKFFIGIDRDDLVVNKLAFSKKKEKYINVNIPIEKIEENNASYTYAFIKAGELVANKSYVYNLIRIYDYKSGFAIYVDQYRLNDIQIDRIENQMSSFTYSEFEKARKDYEKRNQELIEYFGGMSGPCD